MTFKDGATFGVYVYNATWQVLNQPLHLYKNISVPAGSYGFVSHGFAFTSAGNHRITYHGSFNWGGYYTGDLKTLSATAEYRPNAHLDLAINDTLNVFRLPRGNFDIDLAGVQVSYAFDRFLNLTTFIQADTAQTQAVSANIRLRYTFRPDSDLYVIYNAGSRFQALAAGNPTNVRQQKFAIKITYSWSPRG